MRRLAGVMLLFSVTLAALADEAAVRRMIEEKARGAGEVQSVRRAPWADLYEVILSTPNGPQILYVDAKATVIMTGEAFDAKSGRNLTEERLQKITAVKWESLPLDQAITTKRGNGRRKIAVLSDPYCPYCKRFERDLAKLDDITVHILLYPIIRPESVPLTKSVWCSKDRAKAWNDLMLRDIQPAAKPDCETPVEKLVALGRKLGANSTPTWFLENGQRHSGALPFDEVRRLLDEASPPQRGQGK